MKINNINSSGVNPYQRSASQRAQQAKIGGTQKTDKVEISSKAKEMQKTSRFEKERAQKIETLKQQVQNGTYQADAKKTAAGILKYYSGQ
ncbi:flagellar biosynthesis anti-sigma factor FlgM [Heyndrickxia acidiproducens]|uniref:flagellar biosynthesis anti-sigma factor FlgM n=1 Tax=Heyndrickxia acidiproducens TaxID=1121084 RepID=UPI000370CA4C|nr:flagellar biosynthesis anti-sigma factor FlgM [Heyndrickxia acidiproducens]